VQRVPRKGKGGTTGTGGKKRDPECSIEGPGRNRYLIAEETYKAKSGCGEWGFCAGEKKKGVGRGKGCASLCRMGGKKIKVFLAGITRGEQSSLQATESK